MSNAPKSAFELAMESLKAADHEAGVEETTLTGSQKAPIAEARADGASRLAGETAAGDLREPVVPGPSWCWR